MKLFHTATVQNKMTITQETFLLHLPSSTTDSHFSHLARYKFSFCTNILKLHICFLMEYNKTNLSFQAL